MFDGSMVQAIVGGIVGGGISISTIPLLFKGDLLFKREFVKQDEGHGKEIAAMKSGYERQIADLTEYNDKLEAANAKLETELREQYKAAIDQNRDLLGAVKFLQGLGGLAASERRRPTD